jgi:hypothetical protein
MDTPVHATEPGAFRVASNVEAPAASLVEWVQLLKDAVPECEAVIWSFAENDLMVLRDDALALIRAQPTYPAVLTEPVREERTDGNPSSAASHSCHRGDGENSTRTSADNP